MAYYNLMEILLCLMLCTFLSFFFPFPQIEHFQNKTIIHCLPEEEHAVILASDFAHCATFAQVQTLSPLQGFCGLSFQGYGPKTIQERKADGV